MSDIPPWQKQHEMLHYDKQMRKILEEHPEYRKGVGETSEDYANRMRNIIKEINITNKIMVTHKTKATPSSDKKAVFKTYELEGGRKITLEVKDPPGKTGTNLDPFWKQLLGH